MHNISFKKCECQPLKCTLHTYPTRVVYLCRPQSPSTQLVLDHRKSDCFRLEEGKKREKKLGPRREVASPVTTCPGIIPFCSTAGLSFLCVFSHWGGQQHGKQDAFLEVSYTVGLLINQGFLFVKLRFFSAFLFKICIYSFILIRSPRFL